MAIYGNNRNITLFFVSSYQNGDQKGAATAATMISLSHVAQPDGSPPLDDYDPHLHRNVKSPTT